MRTAHVWIMDITNLEKYLSIYSLIYLFGILSEMCARCRFASVFYCFLPSGPWNYTKRLGKRHRSFILQHFYCPIVLLTNPSDVKLTSIIQNNTYVIYYTRLNTNAHSSAITNVLIGRN